MFDILEFLEQRPAIKIIDVGAMSLGQGSEPYAALLNAGVAKVIGFEPVQTECDKLNAMSGGRHLFLPYAVGDGSERTFRTCNFPMTSSLYEPNTPLLDHFQNLENLVRVVSREPIQTHRLDDIADAGDPDLIKLDVQGAELDVIGGAEKALAHAVVVHTEVELVPLYRDQPLFAEIDQHMRQHGYFFHKFAGVAGRAFKPIIVNNDVNQPLSQILWAEAVYVRSFMGFEQLSARQLLVAAVILHMVYGSFDLTALALRHYDAKAGTQLADAYVQRLAAPARTS